MNSPTVIAASQRRMEPKQQRSGTQRHGHALALPKRTETSAHFCVQTTSHGWRCSIPRALKTNWQSPWFA